MRQSMGLQRVRHNLATEQEQHYQVKWMDGGNLPYSPGSSAECSVMAYIGRIVGRSKMEGIYM